MIKGITSILTRNFSHKITVREALNKALDE